MWYRIGQFLRAIRADVTGEERAMVRSILSPAAADLFEALPLQDQRHGLDVACALMAAGQWNSDLLAAALLHDAGKARSGLTVFHRAVIVLLQGSCPNWLSRLAGGNAARWRQPFWTHLHHAEIGAELARRAGCSDVTVWLIRNHHHNAMDMTVDPSHHILLTALQREDESH